MEKAECPKCSGSGIITAFLHRDNGKCYTCGGVGRIKVGTLNFNARQKAANAARWNANLVAEALHNGNAKRARHYAELAAKSLFAAGTELAREELRLVAKGNGVFDEGMGNDPVAGRAAADLIIKTGWGIKRNGD